MASRLEGLRWSLGEDLFSPRVGLWERCARLDVAIDATRVTTRSWCATASATGSTPSEGKLVRVRRRVDGYKSESQPSEGRLLADIAQRRRSTPRWDQPGFARSTRQTSIEPKLVRSTIRKPALETHSCTADPSWYRAITRARSPVKCSLRSMVDPP